MAIKHYVDNLSVKPITIKGIQTATFTEKQTTFCGLKIKVASRKDFATQVNGIAECNCEDCKKKYWERMNKPFDCECCKKILDINDTIALSPMDYKRVCLKCRSEGKNVL